MLTDFLYLGNQEIANTTRLQAYLTNVGSPFTSGRAICNCPAVTPAMLGDAAYTTPGDPASPAPWYDADVPVSAEFLGFLPLSIAGLRDNTRSRTVTAGVNGGGFFGPSRPQPRTMVVRGVLVGVSCCGAEYGLDYLTDALNGCSGGLCDGDCLTLFDCCPDAAMTQEQWDREHSRTFRRVSLTDGPNVLSWDGDGGSCSRGTCGGGGLIQGEFTLAAATPWAFGREVSLLDVPLPRDTAECVAWCVHTDDGEPCEDCNFRPCPVDEQPGADPAFPIPTPPQPQAPRTAICDPLATAVACYALDLAARPQWAEDVPVITVFSGAQPMRQVKISLYAKTLPYADMTCDEAMGDLACDPIAVWNIGYVPAQSYLTLDGEVQRAIQTFSGQCVQSATVTGGNGGGVTWPELDCADYCLCIESNAMIPPAADATVSFAVSGRY